MITSIYSDTMMDFYPYVQATVEEHKVPEEKFDDALSEFFIHLNFFTQGALSNI